MREPQMEKKMELKFGTLNFTSEVDNLLNPRLHRKHCKPLSQNTSNEATTPLITSVHTASVMIALLKWIDLSTFDDYDSITSHYPCDDGEAELMVQCSEGVALLCSMRFSQRRTLTAKMETELCEAYCAEAVNDPVLNMWKI